MLLSGALSFHRWFLHLRLESTHELPRISHIVTCYSMILGSIDDLWSFFSCSIWSKLFGYRRWLLWQSNLFFNTITLLSHWHHVSLHGFSHFIVRESFGRQFRTWIQVGTSNGRHIRELLIVLEFLVIHVIRAHWMNRFQPNTSVSLVPDWGPALNDPLCRSALG